MPRLAFRNTGVLVMERLLFTQIRQYRIAVVVKRVISQLILPPPLPLPLLSVQPASQPASYQIGYYVLIGYLQTTDRRVRGGSWIATCYYFTFRFGTPLR